jgi:clan AA aspartic protease (TIGR02281 family)
VLFPVVVATVGEIAASRFGVDDQVLGYGPGVYMVALTAIVAAPYIGGLVAVDRLLVARKGFAILSCLTTAIWAGAGAVLSDGFATLFDMQATSLHTSAALTTGTMSLLVHLKFLWLGLRDTGLAAMQMGVEPRVVVESGITHGRYLAVEELSREQDHRTAASDLVHRTRRMFLKENDTGEFRFPVETVLGLILVAALMYGSYRWIYSQAHYAVAGGDSPTPVGVNSTIIPEGPVIDGAASTARDGAERFVFNATVNGTSMRMVYDDDIRLVTLRAEDALRIGISFPRLDFSDKIKTDKGLIDVAGITINAMSVGSITYRLVPGFVAKPGALDLSILGHSFLGRLATNHSQNNRITFTGTR